MRLLAAGTANVSAAALAAPEALPKELKTPVDGAATPPPPQRPQGQGRRPTRHRAARLLVLLLSIVVFLPVWGLVRHGLYTTHFLPAYRQHAASLPHHTDGSRVTLEGQEQRVSNGQQETGSLDNSHGILSVDGSSDVSSSGTYRGSSTTSSSSFTVQKSDARRDWMRQKQGSSSSSQTRLHLVLSLSTSTEPEAQPGTSLSQPEQQQEQELGKAEVERDRGQVQEQDGQAPEEKLSSGRQELQPNWSRRMMVLPASDDYDGAGPSLATRGGPGHVAVARVSSSSSVSNTRATGGTRASGVLTSVDVVLREAQAQGGGGADAVSTAGSSAAGKMMRGELHTPATIIPGQQLQQPKDWRVAQGSDGSAGASAADGSIGRHQQSPADVRGHRLIIGVTPTYQRAYQAVHITNLVNALRTVQGPLKWIVVEAPYRTEATQELLQRTAGVCWPEGHADCRRIDYVHLETGMREKARHNKGVLQRNCALQFVQDQRLDGVVYFMDDDNTYSPRLFEELRRVRQVGVLPVGFLNTKEYAFQNPEHQHRPMVERPLVREGPGGVPEVYGWETYEWSIPSKRGGKRRLFCTDMAGFAFSSKLLWGSLPGVPGFPRHPVRFEATEGGFLETTFLQKLLPNVSMLEPLARRATEVLVWHTHQETDSDLPFPTRWRLAQPSEERLVPADQDESVWPYVIEGRRHGIKGRSDKWLLPGYRTRDCGPWSLCSFQMNLQEHLW